MRTNKKIILIKTNIYYSQAKPKIDKEIKGWGAWLGETLIPTIFPLAIVFYIIITYNSYHYVLEFDSGLSANEIFSVSFSLALSIICKLLLSPKRLKGPMLLLPFAALVALFASSVPYIFSFIMPNINDNKECLIISLVTLAISLAVSAAVEVRPTKSKSKEN